MSAGYKAIGWNRTKRIYDAVLVSGVVLYLAVFVGAGAAVYPDATAETLLIRGFGTAAFLLLHVVLAIGPACRLNRRLLPLLYNRRHLGVTTFILALAHGSLALFQFHALGDTDPLASLFASNPRYVSFVQFPFQSLGFAALVVLFLMASTSHDFWLNNLSPPVWKRLHMMVYAAYALLVGHVALGALQSERSPVPAALTSLGMAALIAVHVAAAFREQRADVETGAAADGWVDVGPASFIPERRAVLAAVGGERVAVFRYDGKVSAISNVCRHQNGPLGEGRIVDGCVTCPWHGYQYRPEDGAAPPPFTERVATFDVRVCRGRVLVHSKAHPPGTRVEPARIPDEERSHDRQLIRR
jgi:nitrite reductase/ring-hydroxylating ferredoxin subunit/DMSO/TMAO reductase YedYZ heme-binding membrane subunit